MKDRTRSPSPSPKPFTFDRIFSRVEDPTTQDPVSQAGGVSKTDAAFEEGRKWGQEEMQACAEARLADLLEKLPGQIEEMISRRLTEITTDSNPRKSVPPKRKKPNVNAK